MAMVMAHWISENNDIQESNMLGAIIRALVNNGLGILLLTTCGHD